jgi:PAS domain S-box-containing protein
VVDADAGYLRALVAALPEAILVLGPDATITWASADVERVTGHRPADVLGRSIVDFLASGQDATALAAFAQAYEYGTVMGPMPFRFMHADGRTRVVLVTSRACFDDPELGGLVVSFRDHTGAALLDQALRRLAAGLPVKQTLALLLDSLAEPPVSARSWLVRRDGDGDGVRLLAGSHQIGRLGDLVEVRPSPWHATLHDLPEVDLDGLDDGL